VSERERFVHGGIEYEMRDGVPEKVGPHRADNDPATRGASWLSLADAERVTGISRASILAAMNAGTIRATRTSIDRGSPYPDIYVCAEDVEAWARNYPRARTRSFSAEPMSAPMPTPEHVLKHIKKTMRRRR
jgi:hypothetical protein